MKKILALILTLSLFATLFAGCGDKETWMPYELEFGMTYEEAKEVFADIPELKEASANDGYLTNSYMPLNDEVKEFFGMDQKIYVGLSTYAFSFNESKKLYEFMSGGRLYNEGQAEEVYNAYADYYANKTGIEAKHEESSEGLYANWETDEFEISVALLVEEDSFFVYSVIHNKEFELTD